MIVKDVESTNTIVRQIDNLAAMNIEKTNDNVAQLFDTNNSDENNLGFSSLLIAVGSDLAISTSNLSKLQNILNQTSQMKMT